MTKKDYIIIAEALRSAKPSKLSNPECYAHREKQWLEDCYVIAKNLKNKNANFDSQKFISFCTDNNK